jgi:hypothetical protein
MRKLCALMIAVMLVGAALPEPASAQPSWQYGWWQPGPGGQWRWVGSWGPRGRWVRNRGNWVYRSPGPPWRYSRWVRGRGGRWGWGGGWGPGGQWVRYRGGWAYRWR